MGSKSGQFLHGGALAGRGHGPGVCFTTSWTCPTVGTELLADGRRYATVGHTVEGNVEGDHVCMTCASQASSLLSTLPYGVTAAVSVAIGRFSGRRNSEADPTASTREDDS